MIAWGEMSKFGKVNRSGKPCPIDVIFPRGNGCGFLLTEKRTKGP
jgi:hypothetical protein